ncbi:MAG: nucleoside deaminase [Deltaproteobacteria bacterium]|nr:nucleoside deaminase [Deltaproteobacteria bacterium]
MAISDEIFMREALHQAMKAEAKGEVPIGAIAVLDDAIVGRAHNIREETHNPLGHAELLLLDKLSREQKKWRLDDVTIYVTCEPCLMCAGAMLQARIPRLVFGCLDPKAGACGSLYNVVADVRLNHQISVESGVLADDCGRLLTDFFRACRKKREKI